MPAHTRTTHYHSPEDNPWIAVALFAFLLILALGVVSVRYNISLNQWLEGILDFALLVAGVWLAFSWRRLGRKPKREPFRMPAAAEERDIEQAAAQNATLLGYTLDKAPCLWTDRTRTMQAIACGMNGTGKTTLLKNIVSQDLQRVLGPPDRPRRMPMVIFDGKGDAQLFEELLPHVYRAGRMHQLRILNPSRPEISSRYNPFWAPDGRYMERVNMIFGSFNLNPRDPFFPKHQLDYLSNIVRVLYYTGRRYNFYDCIVMMLDELVLREQIAVAEREVASGTLTAQQKLNFEMSVRNLLQSFQDRERVPKIQGLINECMTFTDDDLAAITGHYEDLLSIEEIVDQELILFASLNANRNTGPVVSLGKMILQNIQLTIGKLYEDLKQLKDPDRPLFSVILDEFPAFSYRNFAHIVNTARGARTAFLYSMQAIPQLDEVGPGFKAAVTGAGNTTMTFKIKDQETAEFFLEASAEQRVKRRTVSIERPPLFGKYRETGAATEREEKETRSQDFDIKNLPVGRMEMLVGDDSEGMIHTTVQVRMPELATLPGFNPDALPVRKAEHTKGIGAHLRFRNPDAQKEFQAKRKEFSFKR
jgi:hypothetical protein